MELVKGEFFEVSGIICSIENPELCYGRNKPQRSTDLVRPWTVLIEDNNV
jgi:hypothetical protein